MQKFLDIRFNSTGPGFASFQYRVVAGPAYAMLVIAEHIDCVGASGGTSRWDRLAHREAYWTFPATRFRVDRNNLLGSPEVVWVRPMGFGDNATMVFAAREIVGLDRVHGFFQFQPVGKDGFRVALATKGLVQYAPRSQFELMEVMRVCVSPLGSRRHNPSGLPTKSLAALPAAFQTALRALNGANQSSEVGFEIDTLKQFRDVLDLGKAAYRATISCRESWAMMDKLHYISGERVTIDMLQSDMVHEPLEMIVGPLPTPQSVLSQRRGARDTSSDLEDASTSYVPVDVEFGFSFRCNSKFEVADTLHTY